MKPQHPDIEYCGKHREFVNGLLEKRGGAQHGDWFLCDGFALVQEAVNIASWEEAEEVHAELVAGGSQTVWLPTTGDALAMLEPREIVLVSSRAPAGAISWNAKAAGMGRNAGWWETLLIALLELLRAAEDA